MRNKTSKGMRSSFKEYGLAYIVRILFEISFD